MEFPIVLLVLGVTRVVLLHGLSRFFSIKKKAHRRIPLTETKAKCHVLGKKNLSIDNLLFHLNKLKAILYYQGALQQRSDGDVSCIHPICANQDYFLSGVSSSCTVTTDQLKLMVQCNTVSKQQGSSLSRSH